MKEIKDMLEKMREIIAEQLNCDGETIGLDTSFKDDLGADSLDLFELVMALEEEYGLDVCSGVSSVKNRSGRSRGRSPYTSSVDT